MGFYSDQILPRVTHLMMSGRPLREVRAKALLPTRGAVLEVGFGSGLNLPHYPSTVSRVLAVEPSAVARAIAAPAIAASPFPVEFVGLDGQHLGLADASVDCVVTTWTLCTIPDPRLALAEFARVLKAGGAFIFAEHGRAPDASVARWQDRLDRLQGRIAGGCHLNRKIDDLVAAAPMSITALDRFYISGPKTHTYFYVGVAAKAA
jgi:ubiquinone/menaquinone biosynthesis C-methylase UbiE